MTTGATLLVMMDLALLLWSPRVWKEWMLRERWSSMLPSPGAPLSGGDAETACCAALAVVPIIRGRLRRDGEMAGMGRRQRPQGTQGEREEEEDFFLQPFPFQEGKIPGRRRGEETPVWEETLTQPFPPRSCKGLSSSLPAVWLPPPGNVWTQSSQK